ncbi:MAG: protein phosphatase 2C domain-containing protein [Chloroflexota bacterium]
MAKQPPKIGAYTDIGKKAQNEDAFNSYQIPSSINQGQPAYAIVVADGVASSKGGQQASQIAVDTLRETLQRPGPPRPMAQRLRNGIEEANRRILEVARTNPKWSNMSTTIVAAVVDDDMLTVAHVGDSRAYLIRKGEVHLLTLDHTWVQQALDHKRITPQDALTHPNRHVIQRYLGMNNRVGIDTELVVPGYGTDAATRRTSAQTKVESGDIIMVCSDGLTERVKREEFSKVMTSNRTNPEKAMQQLVNTAIKRGERDNTTAVMMALSGGAGSGIKLTPAMIGLLGVVAAVGVTWSVIGISRPSYEGNEHSSTDVSVAVSPPLTFDFTPNEPLHDSIKREITFSWVSSNISLQSGQAYELVIWPDKGEPMADGIRLGESNQETNLTIAINDARLSTLNQAEPHSWGVLLVQVAPYKRIQYLGGSRISDPKIFQTLPTEVQPKGPNIDRQEESNTLEPNDKDSKP